MSSEYKSVFVPSVMMPSKSGYTYYDAEIDGIQLANDIDAAIEEKIHTGYILHSMQNISSTKYYARTYTEGILLLFQKAL